MIHAVAIFRTRPEQRAMALAAFHDLARDVRGEPGCLEYAVTIDAAGVRPSRGTLGEDAIAIVEKWASLADFEIHVRTAHMAEFSARAKDFVLSRIVHVLEAEGAR